LYAYISKGSNLYFDFIDKGSNLQTSIRITVGLFITEIYANWVRKEELERWV